MSMPFSVAVAICTYNRPVLLAQILSDLQAQSFTKFKPSKFTIFVIDNDKHSSALSTVNECASKGPYTPAYVMQPVKGLATVRNTALTIAADYDFLAFVDDDERVDATWLDTLCHSFASVDSAFGIGPVRPTFPPECPKAFIDSGLYHRKEFSDGTLIHDGNTGNAIIRIEFIRNKSIKFRDDFESTGGEDTCFFSDIVSAGGKGVYIANAVAHEPVPRDRLSLSWVLRRRSRFGATEVAHRKLHAKKSIALVSAQYFFTGIFRIVAAVAATTIAAPFNQGKALKFACAGARGYGHLIGAFGQSVDEYK